MDLLTFKFCVIIWVLRVSKSQSQLLNSTYSLSNQLYSACEDGQPVVPPDQCNTCICFAGQIYCTNIPCPEQDCVNGVDLPQPDACNKCTCREGKVTCSNMTCIPAPYCSEKQLYPAQNKCNACMCLNGFIMCTTNPCAEEPLSSSMPTKPECVPGQHIPRPDDCNNCICFEGQIHCTHLPCQVYTRKGPECTDNQLVYRLDECNECYCFEGRLECSDLVCIRGSKCVHGQVIPKPDSCNACKCVEGHILCTDYQCPIPNSKKALRPGKSSTESWTLDECQEGEVIPPPPPPNDCNTCYCMDNRILCTMNSCEGSDPEIKERLRKPSEQTDLKKFDKQISVEPFINMLSKNYEKLPAKLIHTHAYNGFHQEIKVHASHLPKDATKLLKVLATSLDNSALASISQRLLTSSNSLSNNHDSMIPLDNQAVPTKLLGEGNVLTTQSSKLITSGSLSNETILVMPNAENFDDQNSQSVLPLSEHETIWKTVSSPDNNVQIDSRSSQEEKQNVYYYDNPPSIFAPIDQNNVIRNPYKNSRPGLQHILPTKPTRNTVEKPNRNTQPIYPASNPNLININDGKISYAPFSQDNKQFKPIHSGFVPKRDELPHLRPYQLTKPGHKQVFNYTSSTPTFRPGKLIVTTNNNGGQQNPSQSQFIPNLSNYYPNHVKPQQIPFKPNQNHLPMLNNKGIQHPPLFPNNPYKPTVAANKYKQPQFGLKPGQESVTHLNNKGNQTDQQFKAFSPNFKINPHLKNLPNQKKRISSIANEGSKEIPSHYMVPNSTAHLTNILNPPQIGVDPKHTQHKSSHSQFVPNPSRYKIIEVNPDQEQLIPHSKISDTHAEHYNPPHTSFEPGHDIIIPKVSNKTRKYNTTQSHYEKHTSITYVSEYDPTHPANPLQIMHEPNQPQNAPQGNVYEHYLPNQESQELDLIMSKVSYYLNIPNLQVDQNNSKKGGLSDPESAKGPQSSSYSAEDPTHLKSNEHLPPPSQTVPIQSQHPPGMFDDRGSINGFQYAHNAYEDPRQLKPVYKLPHLELETPQNHQLPGFFDERGSADGFQYPSNSAEDLTHPNVKLNKSPHFDPYTSIVNPEQPKDNPYISPPSQFVGAAQNQHKPGVFDNRGVKDEFQYAHNADKNPTHLKPLHKLLPFTHSHTPFGPTIIQHPPGMFDERASADGFQYPSSSAENPIHSRGNLHNPKLIQFGPDQNQHLPGIFEERGSTDGFQYPSNSVENPRHPKDNTHKLPQSQFLPSPNQHTPRLFDDRGSADGFQYPSNSAENPKNPKQSKQIQPKYPFGATQNQHLPRIFDERGSADGFQYPYNSVENPRHPKDNMHKLPQSQFLPSPNQHTPGLFDDRGSADGIQYPSNSAENPKNPKQSKQIQPKYPFGPAQNQHLPGIFDERGSADGFQYTSNTVEKPRYPKDNMHKLPQSQFLPSPNQHTPGVFDDRGSAYGFHYPSNSAEDSTNPTNNPNTIPLSKVKQPQNQPKPSSLDDGYNNNNPLRPWMHLDHDQYKPSSFDNLLNGVHNIPWSFSGGHNKDSDIVTSAPEPRFSPDYDQYVPSSFDHLFNGIHQIPWSVPNKDNNASFGSDAEITTPRSGFKPKQDQYGPSIGNNPAIYNQNENTDLTDVDDNQLQIEQDVSTRSTELTDSDSTQYNLPELKSDSDPDSLLPTDDGKIPNYYDQLYPLFKAVKKLSDPPIDDPVYTMGSMDQIDLLPFLFPGIAKILNYEPSQDQDDVSPVENHEGPRINTLSKLNKSKLKQLPQNDIGIFNWLKNKLNKLVPVKYNTTDIKNDIDMTKIFNLLSKLTPLKLKHTTELQNIPLSGFDPEIIANIMNDFKEGTLSTTSAPRSDSSHSYENRFRAVPTIPEESRPHAPPLKYPEIHIIYNIYILHQPNDVDDVDIPTYIETDGEPNLAGYMDSEDLSASMFPKMFNPRFRHRPKDQAEECGDGTQWISNCHGCSCYFGQAMCFRLPDCKLRPLGEPMTCKPYSHFKMGCYTCECNGDGVAECAATDCNTEPSRKSRVSGSNKSPLPIFNEFFDRKKTNEIMQYYNFYKKLPKDCPKQDLQTQYPTCERGTSWVSSCHKCECNESSKHECIKIDDCELDVDSYGKPGRCKPNSKFYPKTNSMPCVECLCNDEGVPYCPAADYKKH